MNDHDDDQHHDDFGLLVVAIVIVGAFATMCTLAILTALKATGII